MRIPTKLVLQITICLLRHQNNYLILILHYPYEYQETIWVQELIPKHLLITEYVGQEYKALTKYIKIIEGPVPLIQGLSIRVYQPNDPISTPNDPTFMSNIDGIFHQPILLQQNKSNSGGK